MNRCTDKVISLKSQIADGFVFGYAAFVPVDIDRIADTARRRQILGNRLSAVNGVKHQYIHFFRKKVINILLMHSLHLRS